jgi:hypothetical protein
MPIQIPTLPVTVHPTIRVALDRLVRHLNDLETRVISLQEQAQSRPAPLTLDEIRDALQATGTHPLNVTGLPGGTPNA